MIVMEVVIMVGYEELRRCSNEWFLLYWVCPRHIEKYILWPEIPRLIHLFVYRTS